jgi:NADH:ubiquinone oxidoreductase subunit 5 (subunit L)/multisubunit Na+/H+ antiporter MnhA subunit
MLEYLIILFLPLISFFYCIVYGKCIDYRLQPSNEGPEVMRVIILVVLCFLTFYVIHLFDKNYYKLIEVMPLLGAFGVSLTFIVLNALRGLIVFLGLGYVLHNYLMNPLWQKKFSFRGIKIMSIAAAAITCYLSFYVFYQVGLLKNPYYLVLGTWVNSDTLYVEWSFLFDSLTVTMLVIVTTVSLLVHVYASSYMEEDPNRARFMSYLSLFTFFMIILVTGDNFLQLFLGWEGVGLCSYLLISF